MFIVQALVVLLGISLCILPSRKVFAQQFGDIGIVYEAGRNKIGLITYCRNNQLIDPGVADRVVLAVETGLRELESSETFDTERGDRAQQAGEDGFWETGRRRDIASVAALFRTTPADLCREWADETLRAQAPRPYREVKTFIIDPPGTPRQPLSQAETAPLEPTPVVTVRVAPARPAAVVNVARSAPVPPLPERAPFLPTPIEPEFISLQRNLPRGGDHTAIGTPVSAHISATTIIPKSEPESDEEAEPALAPLEPEDEAPLPRQQTSAAAAHSRLAPSHPLLEKRSGNPLVKAQRCLMPGCKWPTPRERGFWQD